MVIGNGNEADFIQLVCMKSISKDLLFPTYYDTPEVTRSFVRKVKEEIPNHRRLIVTERMKLNLNSDSGVCKSRNMRKCKIYKSLKRTTADLHATNGSNIDLDRKYLSSSEEQQISPFRSRGVRGAAQRNSSFQQGDTIEEGVVSSVLESWEHLFRTWLPESGSRKFQRAQKSFLSHTQLELSPCKDAKIAPFSTIRQRKGKRTFYKGIEITIDNCHGLRRVYDVHFRVKEANEGRGNEDFIKLKTAVSQFLRWSIDVFDLNVGEIWKEETLFQIVSEMCIVQTFTDYIGRNSPSTLRTKAISLKKVCDVGIMVVSDPRLKGKLELMVVFLQNISSAAKRHHRAICQQRKSVVSRLASGRMLSTDEIRRAGLTARNRLDTIVISYQSYRRKGNNADFRLKLVREGGLKKWCINFLTLLMIAAGGQRPQVFSQLQLPTRQERLQLFGRNSKASFIEFRTVREKRERHYTMPKLILPISVKPYLKFHMDVIRPFILERTKKGGCPKIESLLVNPQTGNPLKPAEVTTLLRESLTAMDPSLSRVTAMSLRRSHATEMFHLYRRGEAFRGLNMNLFLRKLSRQMNTSCEQLVRTYIGCDDKEAATETREFVEFWRSVLTE